ncbi:MAG: C25 family cysteine peptidase, partial [bacterium]
VMGLMLLGGGVCAFGAAGQGVLLYTPAATVSRFSASVASEGGPVRVQWQTTVELGVDAFRVLRQRDGGTLEPVGPGLLRSQGNEEGGLYELVDPLARVGDTVHYQLLMISRHSPDQPVADWTGTIMIVAPTSVSSVPATKTDVQKGAAVLAQAWIGSGSRVLTWTNATPADRVRLSVRDEGVHRVSVQELADASGWGAATVSNALAATNVSLSCLGVPVAWMAEGTNLFFYGVPAGSRFAPENVYWVALGAGSNMAPQVMTPGMPATTNEWFINQITRQGTGSLARVSYSSLADSSASYVSTSLLIGNHGATQFIETLTGCATGLWTGTVNVNLLSYYGTGTDDHLVRVLVGGQPVGTPSWSDEQYLAFTYPFSSSNLVSGVATLSLTNIAAAPQITEPDNTGFLCMSYAYSFPCVYRPVNSALRCTGGESNTVAVSGFSTNDLVVLDITVASQPGVVAPVTIAYDAVAGNWTATFPCGGTGQVYQVFSKSAGTQLPAVRGVADVDWSDPTNAADYVILIPPEAWRPDFRAALQPLADFRNAQGLKTRIVDVESLYNRYSHGLADPLAIKAFCGDGYTNGAAHPLRYLLLAGAGALDFKQQRLSVNDYTACLIPPLISGQRFLTGEGMTVSIDAAFGDVNNDGIPEMAVGRLPTSKTQDLAVVVQKTIAYEGALAWKQQASVGADWDNVDVKYYPFSVGTDRLIAPLTLAGRTVAKHYPVDNTGDLVPVKINSLFPALVAGSGIFHFFGHTDEQNLGGGTGKLLRNADILAANWQKPAIGVVIGCRPNRWQSLTATVCIMPYGLFATNTGFVAALGATGYMLGDEGEDLAVSIYSNSASQGTVRLGDVWRRGLEGMAGTIPSDRLLCYSLIGDPALVFRHDVSARGTPVSWLINYGQTAPNAELADPDSDGWATWQEYQASTGPTNCELQIKALPRAVSGRYTISFEADSNRQYALEYKASLVATDDWQAVSWGWTNATEWTSPGILITPQGPVTTVETPLSVTDTQAFFRIHNPN